MYFFRDFSIIVAQIMPGEFDGEHAEQGDAAMTSRQLGLFDHVALAYLEADGKLDNGRLYRAVAERAGLSTEDVDRKIPIGSAQIGRSPVKRKIRWYQQTLKKLGLLERVEDTRGAWQITDEGKKRLRKANPEVALLAFSTNLGIAIWGSCERVFSHLDAPITLCLTSPPYPLRTPRAYGNPPESEYVDFICRVLEPIVANLAPGGSICLNVSNDIFLKGSPGRSLYREKMVIALTERFGLYKMDELIWHNPSKPPGPVRWASLSRVQLNCTWEPVYWFTNDPMRVKADNRRVLLPHTDQHMKLMLNGGENRTVSHGDGAYRIKPGSFGGVTEGRIPRNVLQFGHACSDQMSYKAKCRENGIPANEAPMPLSLASFLIKFLTEPNDIVAEPLAGSFTTAKAAELLGRRWVATEQILEYAKGSAERFKGSAGFWLNPMLSSPYLWPT